MFSDFVKLGISHIIPLGYDHILFIILLYFSNSDLKKSLLLCSIFTVAHSITLFIAIFQLVKYDAYWVEIFIALSILIMGLQNMIWKNWNIKSGLIIFLFGLMHGLGFANSITNIHFQTNQIINSILGFNIGIEIAQTLVILFCYFLISKPFMKKEWYQSKIITGISLFGSSIALFWVVQKILN